MFPCCLLHASYALNPALVTGRKLKERNIQLSAEADLAWFKLFERHDIPKRIIETEEMREAVRKTARAVCMQE